MKQKLFMVLLIVLPIFAAILLSSCTANKVETETVLQPPTTAPQEVEKTSVEISEPAASVEPTESAEATESAESDVVQTEITSNSVENTSKPETAEKESTAELITIEITPLATLSISKPGESPTESTLITATTENELRVYLNGNRLTLEASPFLLDGKVMIPVEEVLFYFSRPFTVTKEGETITILDEDKEKTILLTANSSSALINESTVELDSAVTKDENGIFFIPLSSFRTLFDADNQFKSEYNSAYIVESGLC